MTKKSFQNEEALVESVKESLQKSENSAARLRRVYRWLLIASTTGSALATFIAGITASQGPLVGEGTSGWRLAFIVAAAFGFVSTFSSGASQQLKVSDRCTGGKACAGKLKSLQVMIFMGSCSWDEIAREYEGIVRSYPDLVS